MSLAEQLWRDDNLRADAMRHGSSGSGIGWRSHKLQRERRRSKVLDSAGFWAAAAIVTVLVLAMAWPR